MSRLWSPTRIWPICRTGVDDVPYGRGVLFEVLRVGVDGTDKEIDDAKYGDPPEGYDLLVTGNIRCLSR
jgi:glucose 1-dehydrogenase